MTPEIGSNLWPLATTLWLCQNSYWKWPIYSGFTHWKWWFSIVMLVYQRVSPSPSSPSSPSQSPCPMQEAEMTLKRTMPMKDNRIGVLRPVLSPSLSSAWPAGTALGDPSCNQATVHPRCCLVTHTWIGEGKGIAWQYPHNILQNTTSWAWIDKCDSKQKSEIALAHFCNQRHATSCNHLIIGWSSGWPPGATHHGMPCGT